LASLLLFLFAIIFIFDIDSFVHYYKRRACRVFGHTYENINTDISVKTFNFFPVYFGAMYDTNIQLYQDLHFVSWCPLSAHTWSK